MLYFNAFETLFALPFFLTFTFLWAVYFTFRKGATAKQTTKRAALRVTKSHLYLANAASSILTVSLPPLWIILPYWWALRGYEGLYCANHLHLSNTSFNFFFLLTGLGFGVWSWLTSSITSLQGRELQLEYFMGLFFLFFYLPIIVLMNTALGAFFVLELSSNLVLLTFVSLQNLNKKTAQHLPRPSLGYGFHLIFFQFWASFFSSILILYSILCLYFLFGTTEWSYLDLLLDHQPLTAQASLLLTVTLGILLLGFVIKLGVAPFFAYKLELYQGLPLYSLVFYSLVYFFLFMSGFFMIFGYYFPSSLDLMRPWLSLALVVLLAVFGFFLFESLLLRQFFALSSAITATNLFTLLL